MQLNCFISSPAQTNIDNIETPKNVGKSSDKTSDEEEFKLDCLQKRRNKIKTNKMKVHHLNKIKVLVQVNKTH